MRDFTEQERAALDEATADLASAAQMDPARARVMVEASAEAFDLRSPAAPGPIGPTARAKARADDQTRRIIEAALALVYAARREAGLRDRLTNRERDLVMLGIQAGAAVAVRLTH